MEIWDRTQKIKEFTLSTNQMLSANPFRPRKSREKMPLCGLNLVIESKIESTVQSHPKIVVRKSLTDVTY